MMSLDDTDCQTDVISGKEILRCAGGLEKTANNIAKKLLRYSHGNQF